ncbi:bifunctional 3-(3-hydroxy-phenyl)propionate/3-hydroxycinnamic acid hydroxylase [Nonomuraea rosea]|uniref:Bifunctional 3-(3-hydroxy-phenyl)propionate/3-hydroxycinnamic acid hydroxylase n=1 Tax=Nonomuraea rosea TaxID=638574 RepID=A0ABP7A505_9ACTN
MNVVPVLVVGAGPTGITAATLLARRGIQSLIVDPHPNVYPLPRAVHLDDEVMRILQEVGVADEFAAISRPALGMRLMDGELRTITEFRRDRLEGHHGWPQANMFDQPDLEALLRANLSRHPQAELRPGTEVVHIEPGLLGDPIRVRLRDVASRRVWQVQAHAVLGCDGANGITRESIGARMRDLRFAERWLVVDVRCAVPLQIWDGIHQVCDPERAATFMRIGADRYRWEFRVRPGETESELVESLPQLLAPWTRGVPQDELQVLRKATYTFRAQVADRWRKGRVFLLGDAAHLTPPFIGQGMGAGLRDAANLVWKLAMVLSEGGDERLLDTYQAERGPHVTRMIRLAVTIGRAMIGGRASPDGAAPFGGRERGGGRRAGATLRRMLLAQAGRVPAIHAITTRSTSPRLRRGLLVRPHRVPVWRDLAGTLPPQPWVTVDGECHRLDDVLGNSFAIIALGPIDPELASLARRLRAPIVRVRPATSGGRERHGAPIPADRPGEQTVIDEGALTSWLLDAGAGAVLLRPDRAVLAAAPLPQRAARIGTGAGAEIARDAAVWLQLLPPTRTAPTRSTPASKTPTAPNRTAPTHTTSPETTPDPTTSAPTSRSTGARR